MNEIPKAQGDKTAGMAGFISSQHPPVDLFRINPGIPCDYALEQASLLMGCIHKLLLAGAVDEDGQMIWAAYYLSGFAKAILADVEVGRRRIERKESGLNA